MNALAELPERLAWYRDGGRTKLAYEARCRMCLRSREKRGGRQLTRHHIVEQSFFTDLLQRYSQPGPFTDMEEWTRVWKLRDAEANIVPLCAHCHRDVEADSVARSMLRKVLGTAEVAFAIALRGSEWFDERYPRLGG